MATWRYIKGVERDFKECDDRVLALFECNGGVVEVYDPKPLMNNLYFTLIALRERVTSVNDDRLARDFGVDQLIAERGSRYGNFAGGAEIMRELKHVMHEVDGWNNLTASQKEALDMIQHKIGRILNGDPTYDDNWKDIAGYATLVAEELNGVKK